MLRTVKTISMSFFVLLLSAVAFAQGGSATGDLHVSVKDPKGNGVTNATVTVQDVAKGLERTATGDGQGGYNAQLLPPGNYTVTVVTPGFTKVESTGVSHHGWWNCGATGLADGGRRQGSRGSQLPGGTRRNLSQFDDRHRRRTAHRESSHQRTQLHQLHAHRFASRARQRAQHRRRARPPDST